ncbi:hypothetical protein CVT26_007201 [Gymnopilus dilepis]|uniref:CSC1/OSCA1-like 7TM region domain-containing protein n=1 Tax=Gymnopilus dilepis TaxID=231916 RepID=A0A409W069_9AGAR|nr:hypothetical protein CVT26_007201 [Gymnopilus dilepis]
MYVVAQNAASTVLTVFARSTDPTTAKSASTATFVTALVFNAAVFGIELAVFTLLRPYFKSIYEPRTYAAPPEKRIKTLTRNRFLWPIAVWRADYRAIISANGLDAYFFVRFLRVMCYTLVPIWIISWIVLLPLTSVNTRSPGFAGLDRFTFGNVEASKQARYAGHLILVYFFTFWILHNIRKEMRHFLITRQQHLIERSHSKSVQANTILITGIPRKYLTQDALFRLFNELPGGVKKIWINRDLKEIPDIYDRRLAACSKLEAGETKLLRTAVKLRLKALKEHNKAAKKSNASSTESTSPIAQAEIEVPESERPTHKLGFLGLFGEKVDTINWARKEIEECNRLLDEKRAKIRQDDERGSPEPTGLDDAVLDDAALDAEGNHRPSKEAKFRPQDVGQQAVGAVKGTVSDMAKGAEAIKERVVGSSAEGEYPPMNSAFITFNKQISAHLAVQVLAHHEPYRMSNRYIEVSPDDVIWSNLNMNPYEQKVRIAISWAATAALIIFWAIPVAFVGVVSNIHTVCATAKFLAWICKLPAPVVGIISGILPPVLLAVLMMLLPIVLRLLARFEGIPKYTGLELSLMNRFFIFQVVHSFLIVTLSSGIVASLHELLNNPTSVTMTLAQQLPQASTFFLTYIILQGLSGVAGGFLRIVPLVIYYVKLFLLGSTPRSVYGIKYGLGNVAWGTTFPGMTLLVVITLGYSIISPIINGLACATFFMFYMLYKYLFLYVYQQPSTTDTGGLFYPKALQHIFVGLYVQQVCLCVLFFLAKDENLKASAVPEGALMVVLIILTAGIHIIINNSYGPLLTALPLSLQHRTYSAPTIEARPHSPTTTDPESRSAQPSIEAENPALLPSSQDKPADADKLEKEEDEEGYGFAHPAASRPQRTVWIPKDSLGLGAKEKLECRERGIKVSDANAVMDESGKVDVSGYPPDLI